MELRDLTVRFGDKVVFDHRDFTFSNQGVTLLTGPSGVGKTTLLKALFEQYRPASAFLFQEDRLLPWRTVEQHLTDVMPPFRRLEAPGILKLVELEGEEKSYPAELSGGMAKAKDLAEIAKLKVNNATEQDAIRKAYIEIGKLYFAQHADDPDPAFAALCAQIAERKEKIAYNDERITDIKLSDGITDADIEAMATQIPLEDLPAEDDPE